MFEFEIACKGTNKSEKVRKWKGEIIAVSNTFNVLHLSFSLFHLFALLLSGLLFDNAVSLIKA